MVKKKTRVQLAKDLCVTRQSVWRAIKLQKIIAIRKGVEIPPVEEMLEDYTKNKWQRKYTVRGRELFGEDDMSVKEVSEVLGTSVQMVYHFMRYGYLKHRKVGRTYIISREDMEEYIKFRT